MSTPPRPLDPATIAEALLALPGWCLEGNALRAGWRFGSFAQALGWMHELVPDIDRHDHHPSWTNVYNRVEVVLTTHDAGNQVTQRDLDLAALLSARASAAGAQVLA